jgi:hypothetical protein
MRGTVWQLTLIVATILFGTQSAERQYRENGGTTLLRNVRKRLPNSQMPPHSHHRKHLKRKLPSNRLANAVNFFSEFCSWSNRLEYRRNTGNHNWRFLDSPHSLDSTSSEGPPVSFLIPLHTHSQLKKTKLHGLSPRASYTDRAIAAYRRSDCQLFRIEGCHVVSVTDPYGRILGFLDRSSYFSIK